MEKDIIKMVKKKNKRIKTDLYLQIYSVEDFYPNDEIELNLREGDTLFKSVFLIKGEIFPTPKNNNILYIKEIFLNYDNNLNIKLYIYAEISQRCNNIAIQPINKGISLLGKNLFNFLKESFNLKEDYFSSVFIVKENDFQNNFYKIYNFRDLKEYILPKNSINNLNSSSECAHRLLQATACNRIGSC